MSDHTFDRDYWEHHWSSGMLARDHQPPAHRCLAEETGHLTPRTALDVGCGAGAESIWLAGHGWQVTGADISPTALAAASARAERGQVSERVTWVEADLTTWTPEQRWDLVVTAYAHPTIPHTDFYRHISGWVVPGGTLLIVGHRHSNDVGHGHHHHPPEATVTLEDIVSLFDTPTWAIETARNDVSHITAPDGTRVALNDVIVRVRHAG